MKRRIFSVLIALALCLSLLPAPALAAEGGSGTADDPWTCGDGVTAVLSDDGATLTISPTNTGTGAMKDYVFSSDCPWSTQKSSILKVVIQEGVTSIGKNAFYYFNKLDQVVIPESVTSIGDRAFYDCSVLSTVKLPSNSNLTSIGTYVFSYCRGLTSIEIPSGVKTLGENVFSSTGLTEVTIPDGVTSIGKNAFNSCKKLTTVNIPASVETIGANAFQNSPDAEIHYPGTTEEWNTIVGSTDIGITTDKVHTSDSDVTYQVTIVDGGEGARGSGTYKEDAKVSIFAGTKDGYAFTGWKVKPEDANLERFYPEEAETSFIMPANDVTLTATWAEAVAEIDGRNFADLQTAFDYATDPTYVGDTVTTLLKNVTVDEAVKLTSGTVTLDGQGYTLTGTHLYTLNVSGGTLTLENVTVENNTGSSWGINASSDTPTSPSNITIRDTATVSGSSGGISQDGGTLTVDGTVTGTGQRSTGINALGTTLTINGGAVISGGSDGSAAGVNQGGGTLTVNGGTISGYIGLSVSYFGGNDATVSLKGGTFTGLGGNAIVATSGDYPSTGRPLSELPDTGYTIYKADGTALTAEELESNRTGPGAFTVDCAHASVQNVTPSGPDENGVVTVTAPCQVCGKAVTLGTLTKVGSGQTITFGGDDPEFRVEYSGAFTVTGYAWTGPVLPSEKNAPQITPLISSTGTCSCSCTVTLRTTGGTNGSVKLDFIVNVEAADIAKADQITLDGGADQVVYDGKEHRLDPDKITICLNERSTLSGSGYAEISLLDDSGTEAESWTDAGTYKIKLTGKDLLKGSVTLTSPTFTIEKATPTIAWAAGTEESHEYTGGPMVIEQGPSVTLVNGETYNEDVNGEITYSYATEAAGPYTPGLPTAVGTYYVKAGLPAKGNYAYAETAGTLKLTITKATSTVTPPVVKDLTYNGTAQALVTAAEASVGEVQYSLTGADGPWSTSIPTATAPGDYTVWYKVDETANYSGVEAASVSAKIEKATVVAASQSLPVKNNQEKTYTLDLSPYLPTLPQGQEYGKVTYELTETEIYKSDYIAVDTVTLTGTVLTVPVKAVNTTDIDSVAFITVTIKSDNFQDISMIISVASTNRTPVTITGVTPAGWTYDGKSHPGYSGTPSAGEYTGELSVTYRKWSSGNDPDGEPKDAGTYQVLISVPYDNTEYEGETTLFCTVEQAQVTVKADNQTANVGDPQPELTYQVSGLAAGESLKAEPTPACTPDMDTAGTYPITISGGVVPDGGNYKAEIVYQNGTLTVSEKSAPPVNPDDLEIKLEVKEGFTEVPPALRALEHLNTPAKLTQVMRTLLTQTGLPEGNTVVYDVSLMVSNDGGQNWSPATPANFPSGGLTVTLPYPAGTDSTYQFTVVHMFTTTASGKIPGNTESPAVTNTEQGLRFTVTGLSPISVGWRAKTTGTGGSSGGGGGGSGVSTYRVTVERTAHGKVTSDRSSAGSGSPVTLTVQPDRGYRLESLTVTDSRGNKLQLTDKGGGKYSFTMSGGDVTIKAVFAPLADSSACDGGAACPSRAFTDLKSGAWYHEAVDFVLRSGLMNGYGNGGSLAGSLFGPEDRLSRAQFAQILYNKEGRPAGVGSAPFTDVAPDAWCAPAVAWAAERGIAGGYGGGLFGLDDAITREQLAVMLWRYAGSPAAPSGELSFMDAEQIGAQAREALGWAVQTGVMNGKTGGALDPKGFATRAQTAQMLKNFLEDG